MEKRELSSIISLISEIHTKAADFLQERLARTGLTDLVSSHGNILFQLSISGKLTMKELSARINRDKSTATALVKKLETAGFITREQSEADNRVTSVSLSEAGRRITGTTSAISKELVDTCYAGFTDEEKEAVYGYLKRIGANFSREI
jgi:DNA-binding MarR family transcriptional regulator